jgi:hypothetical protein
MEHVDLDGRANRRTARWTHEAGELAGVADLVDQRRDARAALAEIVDGVRRDAEELRTAETRHVLGEARLVGGAAEEREALFGGVERFGDQRFAMALDARDLRLELLAARPEVGDVRLGEPLEVFDARRGFREQALSASKPRSQARRRAPTTTARSRACRAASDCLRDVSCDRRCR